MPKVKISEYSATANSNTDVASINIDEGCAPSGINNAIRAVMGHLKDFQQGTYGDPFNGPVNGTLGATTASTANVTTLTTSSTITHNGGTANGVAYLNGSKVLTTGSALVFDGTNLGLGVTPSAWDSTYKAIQVGARSMFFGIGSEANMANNAYYNSGYKNVATSAAGLYTIDANVHKWYNAASGTAGNAITFTQAMTLDASGNLGVGATSIPAGFRLYASGGSMLLDNNTAFRQKDSVGNNTLMFTLSSGNNFELGSGNHTGGMAIVTGNSNITFTTNSAERARIDTSGNLLVGTTSSLLVDSGGFVVYPTTIGETYFVVKHDTGTSSGATYAGFTYATSVIGSITQNGTTSVNFNGYIVNPSDQRLKTNIIDASSSLLLIDKIKIRSFDWITEEKNQSYGVIAQELETVFPEAVNAPISEDGFYGVDYTKLVPMLVKAIQEQQALITQLTARLTALESA